MVDRLIKIKSDCNKCSYAANIKYCYCQCKRKNSSIVQISKQTTCKYFVKKD